MAKPGRIGLLLLLVASGLHASGCITFRSASANRTDWEELPNDPRPELHVHGTPRVAVVFEGVFSALGDQTPAFDELSSEHYLKVLRQSGAFTEVAGRDDATGEGLPRVRVERLFVEDAHTGSNLTQAVTVPGLLGYRFALTATYRLHLERADGAPVVYEARSRLTHIYHAAAHADASRLLVYGEADRANTEALVNQLRADPELFDAAAAPLPAE